MTRLISIKSISDLPENLKGKVEFHIVDNKVEAVIVKEGESYIRITQDGTYSPNLKILKEQPKKEVTRYKLKGAVCGMEIKEQLFNDERTAKDKLDQYEYKFPVGEIDLKIEPVVEFVEEDKI